MATPKEDLRRLWHEHPARFVFTASVMALLLFAAFAASTAIIGGLLYLFRSGFIHSLRPVF